MNPRHLLGALACATLGTLFTTPALAQGHKHGAHQHGVAKLAVAVDGNQLEITLESPLDNLLGFERAPRTNAEREAVRKMAQRFHLGSELFTPTAAAGCTPKGAELASDVLDAALLAPAGSPAAAGATKDAASAKDSHADLDATVRFQCANPAALKGVDVGLFKAFPKFRQIDAAVAAGNVQRGSKLNPKQTSLSW
jgi:hypothetical protein